MEVVPSLPKRARSGGDDEIKELILTEVAQEVRHERIAAVVEASSGSCDEQRFVKMADREEDTDMTVDMLESLHIGQSQSMWKGVAFGKCACDWQVYASLISELQPRTIIDLGSWAGGSALFFADFAQMLVDSSFCTVVSLDITLKNVRAVAREHPKIQFHECSTQKLEQLFTQEFCATLPHPWLISEDAHYHFEKVLPVLHALMCPGDYLICEDTSGQMHDWFDRNNQEDDADERAHTMQSIEQLRQKSKVLRYFCILHGEMYRCDTKYLDMFGYNVGKHWNSIVKRIK
ncbi:unnamed protein product [Polarella glacialis]|uniref:Methyltransferase domain-containing protein n=1 Tax=Polarella glacialis TaxID=89957 RepID=A0A813LL08_POLGL|nr:unnamed protein product [Polarella glacialis]